MTHSQSLLDFLRGLIGDGASRARFSADPDAAFAAAGIVATTPRDVYDALVRIGDDQDLAQGFQGGRGRGTDVLHVPPPPPPEYFAERDAHGAAVHYLDNYVSSGFDDDLGPFTGSSAEHGADSVHDYDPPDETAHDYTGTDTVHDYSGHGDHSDAGSDPGQHGGFDTGGL